MVFSATKAQSALVVLAAAVGDQLGHAGGAHKGDGGDVWRITQRVHRLDSSVDDIEETIWQTGLLHIQDISEGNSD